MIFRAIVLSLFLVSFLVASKSQALVELRGHYGINYVNPSKLNDFGTANTIKKVDSFMVFGFDGLVTPPKFPIGFGARFETTSLKTSTSTFPGIGTYEGETGFTRIAALVNYRLLDTKIYLGPIGSFGFSDTAYYKHKVGYTGNYTSSNKTSYSIGVEGGAKLSFFLLGVEAGYLFADYGVPKDGNTEFSGGGQTINLNYSGMYLKAVLGVHF